MVYYVEIPEGAEDRFGLASAPDGAEELFRASPALDIVRSGRSLKKLMPFRIDGAFADYQPNDLGVSVCSSRLKAIIDRELGPADRLEWLPIKIENMNNEVRDYYVLAFMRSFPELLDKVNTIFAGELVVRPTFKKSALRGHSIWGLPGDSGSGRVFVTDHLRQQIVASALTCIGFMPARVSKTNPTASGLNS